MGASDQGLHRSRSTLLAILFASFGGTKTFCLNLITSNFRMSKDIGKLYSKQIYEPRYEKTGCLHMRKQRRRSAPR